MNTLVTPSILVIGTDLHFCYLMRRYVRESAHALLYAWPDENALKMAELEKPALIFLEFGGTEAKGREMIQFLKANQTTCEIPVVLCSWHDEVEQEPINNDYTYLRMPILYDDFLSILQRHGV